MNPHVAALHLESLSAAADGTPDAELYAALLSLGLPRDWADALHALQRRVVWHGGRLLRIGKVVVMKLYAFLREHPHLAIGTAVGLFLTWLAAQVPWIGSLLAPLVALVAIPFGMAAGQAMDGGGKDRGTAAFLENLIAAIREYLRLFVEVWRAVAHEIRTQEGA